MGVGLFPAPVPLPGLAHAGARQALELPQPRLEGPIGQSEHLAMAETLGEVQIVFRLVQPRPHEDARPLEDAGDDAGALPPMAPTAIGVWVGSGPWSIMLIMRNGALSDAALFWCRRLPGRSRQGSQRRNWKSSIVMFSVPS